MSNKKDITVLLITMLVALGLVSGVFLWLANISNVNILIPSTTSRNLSQDLDTKNLSQDLEKSHTKASFLMIR
jgi:hypothetical protein